MRIKAYYIIFFFACLCVQNTFSQENEELKIKTEKVAVKKKKKKKRQKEKPIKPYEPLAPARAAFYSAIVPGLGQAYTGNYWKIPIVYGALGTGVYAYTWNNQQYNRFRDAYKRRLAGFTDDEFYGDGEEPNFSDERLIDFQRRYRRDQELSLLITIGLYVLNIIDANVSAHLQQYDVTNDLSFRPKFNINDINAQPVYGLSLNYSF